MVDLTFLKIQIFNRPQIHKFFLLLFVQLGQEEENRVRIFDEDSSEDAQNLSSPDEEDAASVFKLSWFHRLISNFEAII